MLANKDEERKDARFTEDMISDSHEVYEYERKFLLKKEDVLTFGFKKINIKQTYLNFGQNEKRVRSINDKIFYYTEKTGEGSKRKEFEKVITEEDYNYYLKNFKKGHTLEKERYFVPIVGAKSCEVNDFKLSKPLRLIEVEFESEESMNSFVPPDWFGEEVTDDKSYSSYELAMRE